MSNRSIDGGEKAVEGKKDGVEGALPSHLRPLDPSLVIPPLDPSLVIPPLEEGDDFVCTICRYILYHPLNLSCPHLFCQPCAKDWMVAKRTRKDFRCPACTEITKNASGRGINTSINHKINGSLKIKCPNECSTILPSLGTNPERIHLKNHLDQCPLEPLPCSCCKKKFPRKDLSNHESNECMERIVECDYCKERMTEKNRRDHSLFPLLSIVDEKQMNEEKKEGREEKNDKDKEKNDRNRGYHNDDNPEKKQTFNDGSNSNWTILDNNSTIIADKRGCKNRSFCIHYPECEWIGLNEELSHHLRECGKEMIECNICNKSIRRESLSDHNNEAADIHRIYRLFNHKITAMGKSLNESYMDIVLAVQQSLDDSRQENIQLKRQIDEMKKMQEKDSEEKYAQLMQEINEVKRQMNDSTQENARLKTQINEMEKKVIEVKQFAQKRSISIYWAVPIKSIKDAFEAKQKWINDREVTVSDQLKVRLFLQTNDKTENEIGVYLENRSLHPFVSTSFTMQVFQWKDDKLVTQKSRVDIKNRCYSAYQDNWGLCSFIPADKWQSSNESNWLSSLPPKTSPHYHLFCPDGESKPGEHLLLRCDVQIIPNMYSTAD